jgi:intracellular septation protein
MQFIADWFPLLLFFLAFKLGDIYVATAVFIGASVVQVAYLRWRKGKVGVIPWLTLAIAVVFGGATLLLHDDTFIKWKPTVIYGLFALILAGGRLIFGKNLIASLFQRTSKDFVLPHAVWTRVTWAWVAFFAAMGAANWYIAFHFSTDTWVNFKVWGAIGLFLLFGIGQAFAVARYLPERP